MTRLKWKDDRETMPSMFSDMLENFFGNDVTGELMSQVPSVNVKETKDDFQIEVAAPGMQKDDFEVNMENDILTIAAKKEAEEKQSDKQQRFTRREFNYSSFQRSFNIPDLVDPKRINAKYEDGILRIWLPKKAEARKEASRQIKIS